MSERQKAKEAKKRKLEEEEQKEKEARAQEDSRSLREIVCLLEKDSGHSKKKQTLHPEIYLKRLQYITKSSKI